MTAIGEPLSCQSPTAEPRPVTLAVTGWSAVSSAAIGADDFSVLCAREHAEPADVARMFPEPLPRSDAYALLGFDVRAHLGRKGTSFFDRSTSLALVACKHAIADSGLVIDDGTRGRIGIAFGTTAGSVKSTSDYSRETFIGERPFLVNPVLFPNAVMNCTAGQAAIWFGLKGVNATIAGGPLAAINVLRYGRMLIRCGYVETLLVGAVEEFSPQTAWATHAAMKACRGDGPAGEGAAVLVVRDAAAVRAEGRVPDGEILAAEVALCAPPSRRPGLRLCLTACIEKALDRAGVLADDVWAVASSENGMRALDRAEDRAIKSIVGARPHRIRVRQFTGEAHSASSALQVAAVLGRHRLDPALDGRPALITARSPDGAVGAAVMRGWSRGCGGDGR